MEKQNGISPFLIPFIMVENYDFDSIGVLTNKLLKSTKAVKWIKYVTSENPIQSDIYEFGQKTSDQDSKIFTREIKGEFSYLKMEMQIRFSEMQAVRQIKDIFLNINKNNQELASLVETGGKQLIANAGETTTTITKENKKSLIQRITVVMAFVLVLTCLVLIIILQKWIIHPISNTIKDLERNATQVSVGSEQISSNSRSLAEGASEQAASIEETSSSLEEMSSMTKQNAENANQADGLMQDAN
jgi:methyl-accepting chemotaxis protein